MGRGLGRETPVYPPREGEEGPPVYPEDIGSRGRGLGRDTPVYPPREGEEGPPVYPILKS